MRHILGISIPYIAVGIGLFGLQNGVMTLLLYHILIIVFGVLFQRKISTASYSTYSNVGNVLVRYSFIGFLLLLSLSGVVLYGYNVSFSHFFSDLGLFPMDIEQYLIHFKFKNNIPLLFMWYFAIIHPIVEQLHWRHVCKIYDTSKYLWVVHIAFSVYHIIVLWIVIPKILIVILFPLLYMVSWIWNYFYKKGIPVYLLIVSHIITDGSMMIALFFILR